MGQFSAEKPVAPGSALSGNQQFVICGCGDPMALELHHIAGRGYGDELVIPAATAIAA